VSYLHTLSRLVVQEEERAVLVSDLIGRVPVQAACHPNASFPQDGYEWEEDAEAGVDDAGDTVYETTFLEAEHEAGAGKAEAAGLRSTRRGKTGGERQQTLDASAGGHAVEGATVGAAASTGGSTSGVLAWSRFEKPQDMKCTCEDYTCECKKRCGCSILGDDGKPLKDVGYVTPPTSYSAGKPHYAPYTFRCDCGFSVQESDEAYGAMQCGCGPSTCRCTRTCSCVPPR